MNALMFFLIAHLILSTLSGVAEGGGGVVVTVLTSDITSSDTTIPVQSTAGFLKNDYIVIGNEYIRYKERDSDSFDASNGILGLSSGRGYSDTEAVAHTAGTKVYSSNADPLNSALGFNILATGDSVGDVNLINLPEPFMATTLPRLVTWDYGILQVGIMTYVRTILQIVGGAFIIYMALNIVGAFGRK